MPGTKYPLDDPAEPIARPRVGSRIWAKLDSIERKIDERLGGGLASSGSDDDGAPTITFEPEIEELPVVPDDGEGDDAAAGDGDAGTGEGTANLAFEEPAAFRFPHRRRVDLP